MDAATRDFVRRRADNRCEYCLLGQEYSDLTHQIEHIVAKQHGGRDDVLISRWPATVAISARALTSPAWIQ
jgi:hypothetical protein